MAASQPPSLRHACIAVGTVAAFGAVAVPFGLKSGFLQGTPLPGIDMVLKTMLRTAFFPCLAEEAFWRAMLLPRPDSGGPSPVPFPWKRASLCVLCFMLYHVPSGLLLTETGAARGAWATFTDPRFLLTAFLLGASCTGGYWLSRGSLYVAWFIHWAPVNVWLLLYGGDQKLRGGGQGYASVEVNL